MSNPHVPPHKKYAQEYLCRVKFLNPLPDLPFDPKLIEYPLPADRFYKWSSNALIDNASYPIELQQDISLDLLDLGHYEQILLKSKEKVSMEPADDILMAQPTDNTVTERSVSRLRPIVPWLRKTEYISSEHSKTVGGKTGGMETRMGVSVMKDSQLRKFSNMTIDEQVEAIEKTFDYVNNAEKIQHVKHPNNPNLTVSQVFPLFPDFELWPNEYILAMYDTDPVQHDGEKKDTIAGEEALLQPMANPHNPSERFIAYYAPSDKTIDQIAEKRRLKEEHGDDVEFEENEESEFNHIRNFDPDMQAEKDRKRLFFVLRPKLGAFYYPLNGKITMRRKRAKSKHVREEVFEVPKKILLSKREFTGGEKTRRRVRLAEVAPLENMEEESDDE